MPYQERLPQKTSRKGSREWGQKAKAWALELHEADPTRTQKSICAEIGISTEAFRHWYKRDVDFKGRWNRISTGAKSDGPPDPGPFEDWRRQYVNLEVQNPYTLRTGHNGETYEFQKPFVKALGDPAVQRMVAMYPVRHGKTTIIEHLVPWYLCKNPNARVIIVCSSENHAKERAYAIQQILMDDELYPELHETWGPWIGKPERGSKPWGQKSFYVRGRKDGQRSPSVSCYGAKTKIYGARADLIILDDIDDPGMGPTDRESIMRNIQGPIMTRLSDGGKLVMIGTRCGPTDVYSHYIGRAGWWWDVQSAIKPDGTALCPELYDIEDINQMRGRDMGETAFAMMFMNDPAPEGTMMFPPNLIDNAKGNFDLGEAPEDWERLISLDPSASGKAALVSMAYSPNTREIRVLDVDVKMAPRYEGMREMLARGLMLYKPQHVIIESGGGFKLFSDAPDIRAMIYDWGARVIEFPTGNNKNDPREGIALVATLMHQNRLRFPNSSENAQAKMRVLYEDMVLWRPQTAGTMTFDTVMALWFGCNTIAKGFRNTNVRRIPDPLMHARPYRTDFVRRDFAGRSTY